MLVNYMPNDKSTKNILLICGRTVTVLNFRRGLISALRQDGYNVSVLCLNDERRDEVESLGVTFYCLQGDNRNTNPFTVLSLLRKYTKLIKSLSPDIVFTFQATPNMLGGIAARRAGVKNVYAMVEGAGDVFVNTGLKWKLIRTAVCMLYRNAFRRTKNVFFLNRDDEAMFTAKKLVKPAQCKRVCGIGVVVNDYPAQPVTDTHTFLMIARMVATKGIFEYCRAARIVRKAHPEARFRYLGEEFTVKQTDIQEFIDAGEIEYLGYTRDVRPYLYESSCIVLPSYYREGLPMTIMEAQSCGRPVITTDNVGCRDTVENGINGYLVPVRDAEALAERCIYLLEHPDLFTTLGANAARFARKHFDADKINRTILDVIKSEK